MQLMLIAVGWLQLGQARAVAASQQDATSGSGKGLAEASAPTGASKSPPNPQRRRDAYHFESDAICPFCRLTPNFPEGQSGLHWHDHWTAVGLREYLTVPALFGATLAVELSVPRPSRAAWVSPILFDAAVRRSLRLDDRRSRHRASSVSDGLFVWELLHPTVVDPLLAAWWARESPRVAWQMFVINAQAYGLTVLLYDAVKRLTRRARPWAVERGCGDDPSRPGCEAGSRFRAFYSGHAATTATGAGLICAHHTQLGLYGSDLLDQGICALAVLGTAVTGAMRVASDNHWASDVLVGHLMGYASGYLLPTLLYYREFRLAPRDESPAAPTTAVLPMLAPNALGVSLHGLF